MASIGLGVSEIRLKDGTGTFRIIYLTTRPQGVYVLHCFQKKSHRTAAKDIELARAR